MPLIIRCKLHRRPPGEMRLTKAATAHGWTTRDYVECERCVIRLSRPLREPTGEPYRPFGPVAKPTV